MILFAVLSKLSCLGESTIYMDPKAQSEPKIPGTDPDSDYAAIDRKRKKNAPDSNQQMFEFFRIKCCLMVG